MSKIGIPGWLIGDAFGVTTSYAEFISKWGDLIIIPPSSIDNPPEVDMIICPGGADILPSTYGEVPSFKIGRSNPILEHWDKNILPIYMDRKTPILAICRGMQKLWTMYGGKLIQNNEYHDQSNNQTHQCHELIFTEKYRRLSDKISKVTSRHHQSCSIENGIPSELEVIAYSMVSKNTYDSDVVEIFTHESYPMYCVQYHPEDHDNSDVLIDQFMNELLRR